MHAVYQALDDFFPKRRWSSAEDVAFGKRTERLRLSDEQVRAVVEEYRSTCKYATPSMPDLLERLRSVARPRATQAAVFNHTSSVVLNGAEERWYDETEQWYETLSDAERTRLMADKRYRTLVTTLKGQMAERVRKGLLRRVAAG